MRQGLYGKGCCLRLGVGNSAAQSAVVISAALPRVISPLRGGYIRPSGGLCFAAVGGKVNVCHGSRHISMDRTHSGSILLTITAVALPLQNVPARRAHLNFAPKGVQNITRGFAADITAPRARYNFSPQAKNITDSGFSPRRSLSRRTSEVSGQWLGVRNRAAATENKPRRGSALGSPVQGSHRAFAERFLAPLCKGSCRRSRLRGCIGDQ